jgi:hypothetical protein
VDEHIESIALRERTVGMLKLQWELDRWQYDMGMLEVLDTTEDDLMQRRLRRDYDSTPPDRPYRFLPFFNGYGVLVRDKV